METTTIIVQTTNIKTRITKKSIGCKYGQQKKERETVLEIGH